MSLIADGLVIDDPHKGVRVARFDIGDAEQIYAIRARLESWAAELATPKADRELIRILKSYTDTMAVEAERGNPSAVQLANRHFHMTIYHASGWDHLCDLIELLWRNSPWGTLRVVPGRIRQSVDEHKAIIRALESGNRSSVRVATRRHIESGVAGLKRHMRQGNPLPSAPGLTDLLNERP